MSVPKFENRSSDKPKSKYFVYFLTFLLPLGPKFQAFMILSGSCLGFCNPIFQAVDGMKKGPFYAIKYFLNNSMMLMGHVMDHEHHEFENKAKKNSIFISLDQEYHEANCKMHFQMKINFLFHPKKQIENFHWPISIISYLQMLL